MKAVSAHTVAPVAITPAARGIRIKDVRVTMEKPITLAPILNGVRWLGLSFDQQNKLKGISHESTN